MSEHFKYPCPKCGTTNVLHDTGCKYEHQHPYETFEKEYTDIIIVLLGFGALFDSHGLDEQGIEYEKLQEKVEELPPEKNPWLPRHHECLQRLKNDRRVDDGPKGLRLLAPDERAEQIIPLFEPLQTIYECGPVDGCKDYAVYTMISWCSLKDLTWDQTLNFCTEWLQDTNAWRRESWGEGSIDSLLRSKKHVHDGNLGWGDYAQVAKDTIEESGVESQFDAAAKYGMEADDYA